MSVEITYPASLPRFVRRGRAYVFVLEPLNSTGTTAVTSGTFGLFDRDHATVIPATAVIVSGGIASFALGDSVLDSEDFGDGYIEEWIVQIDGQEQIFEREFTLCRRVPRAVISDADLVAIHGEILLELPPGETSWAGKRSEAFTQLLAHLIARGHNPCEVRNFSVLRNAHLQWSMMLIAEDLDTHTSGPGKWTKLAAQARAERDKAIDTMALEVDTDEDGSTDGVEAAEPAVFLMEIPGSSRSRTRGV